MSLTTAFPLLRSEIEFAFKKIRDQGSNDSANSDALISDLAVSMANSIQKYMESAEVITNHTINPGQIAPAIIPPFTGVGIYSSSGRGNGKGILKFSTNEKLKIDIENAYKRCKNSGIFDNANIDSIIFSLSNEIGSAIHNFALTAIVKIEIIVDPGVVVSGYINIATGVPTPAVSISSVGTGTGIGNLI